MTVVRAGVTYSATVSKSVNNEVLFRFNKITYPDGRVINLSYDSALNLTTVTDNKNNKLCIDSKWCTSFICNVYWGSQGDSQQYDLTYASVIAGSTSYTQLTQIKNAKNNRKESYTYSSALSLPYI